MGTLRHDVGARPVLQPTAPEGVEAFEVLIFDVLGSGESESESESYFFESPL